MWDWVGGRTSETAAVGLLPAALQGIEIDPFLEGAKQMDHLTRESNFMKNPAAMLALSWHYLTDAKVRIWLFFHIKTGWNYLQNTCSN